MNLTKLQSQEEEIKVLLVALETLSRVAREVLDELEKHTDHIPSEWRVVIRPPHSMAATILECVDNTIYGDQDENDLYRLVEANPEASAELIVGGNGEVIANLARVYTSVTGKVFSHESPFVRMGFVSGLREIQESGGDIDHLISGYTTDSDERVRKAACEVLEWNS